MGWGKRRFTVVHTGNNTLINNIRINLVFHVLTTVNLLVPTLVYGNNIYDRI